MAAMEQEKLKAMCNNINNEGERYGQAITTEVAAIKEQFNQNWVSANARNTANEIQTCLVDMENAIKRTFDEKSNQIGESVRDFNFQEGENIGYSGFGFPTPPIDLNLNATLPNGKLGVADGADITSIKLANLRAGIESALDGVVTAVNSCDAFDADEMASLTSGVQTIKTNLSKGLGDVEQSLITRMGSEKASRDSLDAANKSRLEA